MRKHYYRTPRDYLRELKNKGRRDKARAFCEYQGDKEDKETHSFRFYAKGWGVSVSTAHDWISEFTNEIDRFEAYWEVENKRKEAENTQKFAEHQPNTSRTKTEHQNTKQTSINKETNNANLNTDKTPAEHQPNKDYNNKIINNNSPRKSDKCESVDYEISKKLLAYISNIHKIKTPNIDKWANQIRLMRTQDKRAPEHIKLMLDMIFQDNKHFDGRFWRANIRSTDKLRQQYDMIAMQIKTRARAS